MNPALKPQSVRLEPKTIEKLKTLEISVCWVEFKTYEEKINHLIWFFQHYTNNNWDKH